MYQSPKPNIAITLYIYIKKNTDEVFTLRPLQIRLKYRTQLRLGVVSGTDAGSTHFDSLDSAAFDDFDILKIDFKGTLDVFDNVHTDTAGFLRQTLTGDAAAVAAGFTAEIADPQN